MLSEKGYIKRMASEAFTAQNRGTTGKSGGKMRMNDAMSNFFVCRTHDYVLFFRSGFSLSILFLAFRLLHGTISMYALYILKCAPWNSNLGVPCKEQENRQAYCFLLVKGWFTCHGSSDRGIVYSIHAYQIPECSRISAGNPLIQVCRVPLWKLWGWQCNCLKALYWCSSPNVVD